jgi:hypothetical protein
MYVVVTFDGTVRKNSILCFVRTSFLRVPIGRHESVRSCSEHNTYTRMYM